MSVKHQSTQGGVQKRRNYSLKLECTHGGSVSSCNTDEIEMRMAEYEKKRNPPRVDESHESCNRMINQLQSFYIQQLRSTAELEQKLSIVQKDNEELQEKVNGLECELWDMRSKQVSLERHRSRMEIEMDKVQLSDQVKGLKQSRRQQPGIPAGFLK